MVETTKKSESGIVVPNGGRRLRISASPIITLAAMLVLTGCSSVSGMYDDTTDTVGGWFSSDEPQATAPSDPSTADQPYPNLASVPERPTPSTTAEERAAIQQGLVADRDSARYTDSADASAPEAPPRRRSTATAQPAMPSSAPERAPAPSAAPPAAPSAQVAAAPAPDQVAVVKSSPPPAAPTVATPPPATVASPSAVPSSSSDNTEPSSGEQSNLWPRRPAPEPASATPVTTANVSDAHAQVIENPESPARAVAAESRMPASTAAVPRTSMAPSGRQLDSAGNQPTAAVASPPRASTSASTKSDDGPEITRTLISTEKVHRSADGTVLNETVSAARPGTPAPTASAPTASAPVASVPSAPAPSTPAPSDTVVASVPPSVTQRRSDTTSMPSSAPNSVPDQSPSVIVDGAQLEQYQIGFTGPAYLVGTVNFAHGSSAITAAEREMIRNIAAAAQQSNAYIRVIGHASARTAEMELSSHELVNFQESMDRAQSVADALVGAGVPRDRVLVEAMSASQPLFYESMPSGEAGNRRAEILFQY